MAKMSVCRPPKCNFYGAVGFKSNCWSGPAEGAQSTALKEKADYSCAGEEFKKRRLRAFAEEGNES